jgi:hypothetical protein
MWVNLNSIKVSLIRHVYQIAVGDPTERGSNGKDDKEIYYKTLAGKHERKKDGRRSGCRLQTDNGYMYKFHTRNCLC